MQLLGGDEAKEERLKEGEDRPLHSQTIHIFFLLLKWYNALPPIKMKKYTEAKREKSNIIK